jgi:hypothetical protein
MCETPLVNTGGTQVDFVVYVYHTEFGVRVYHKVLNAFGLCTNLLRETQMTYTQMFTGVHAHITHPRNLPQNIEDDSTLFKPMDGGVNFVIFRIFWVPPFSAIRLAAENGSQKMWSVNRKKKPYGSVKH